MKKLCIAFVIVLCACKANEKTTKTNVENDYGMRMYNPKLGNYMPVDTLTK